MPTRDLLRAGRVAQKRRTRQALLEAGLRVLRRGAEPTLEAIATEADVSRATAYRYFPRLEALLAVLPLADLVDDPEQILAGIPSDDPLAGALRAQRYFLDLTVENEPAFRRLLHANLEEMLRGDAVEPVRGTYRLRTLEAALTGLEDRGEATEHLLVALVALSGIEALIAVKDVCGLDADTGRKSLAWAARTLIQAALASERACP